MQVAKCDYEGGGEGLPIVNWGGVFDLGNLSREKLLAFVPFGGVRGGGGHWYFRISIEYHALKLRRRALMLLDWRRSSSPGSGMRSGGFCSSFLGMAMMALLVAEFVFLFVLVVVVVVVVVVAAAVVVVVVVVVAAAAAVVVVVVRRRRIVVVLVVEIVVEIIVVLITMAELSQKVQLLKDAKTTGASGVSAELLKCMMVFPEGGSYLLAVVNALHRHPERFDPDIFRGLVILLPKCAAVTEPQQVRPIVLTECLVKLVASIAVARTLDTWRCHYEMLGGLSGVQVAEVIWAAKTMLARSRMFQDSYVYLRIDISAAFDSLEHAAVLRKFRAQRRPDAAVSFGFLEWLLSHQRLLFSAFGEQWCTCAGAP